MRRVLLSVFLAFAALTVMAQERLEVIQLKHRLADQVLPVLQPLIGKGIAISASGNKLLVRGDSSGIRQVYEILDEIDTAPRRLMISLRTGSFSEGQIAGFTGRGGVVANPSGTSVFGGGAGYVNRERRQETGVQTVQALEDSDAYIRVGRYLPLPMTRTLYGPGGAVVARSIEYLDVGSGFLARARLVGDRVTVEIAPQHSRIRQGVVSDMTISTSVSGVIGEWIHLGGVSTDLQGRSAGIPGFNSGKRAGAEELWLRVERMD